MLNTFGWHSAKYHWLGWILSANQLAKFHEEVALYTDAFGYKVLVECLKLPYTEVHVILDDLNQYHSDLWAIAKIKTYELQDVPFLHVDGDVFAWQSLTDKFTQSDLITQNLEITTEYYREMWDSITPYITYMPEVMQGFHLGKQNLACNMGIFGGNDLGFIRTYAAQSTNFVNENKQAWANINCFNFNIFFEQVLFYELAQANNKPISYLFDEVSEDNKYVGFGDFGSVPCHKTYLHLLGFYKRNPDACKKMEAYTFKHYPEPSIALMRLLESGYNENQKVAHFLSNWAFHGKSGLHSKSEDILPNDLKLHNLLARDLESVGQPCAYESYLAQSLGFWLIKNENYNYIIQKTEDQEVKAIAIEEWGGSPTIYEVDEIDETMLSELSEPILYKAYFAKMLQYIDADDPETLEPFTFLIKNRLRNYIILKIISIKPAGN